MAYYRYQLFFCINLRASGKQCCAMGNAESLRDYAKKRLKKLGLHRAGECRTNTSSCLGRCDEGPLLVIYPDGIWYHYETEEDIDEIIEQHLLQDKIVTRLLLPSEPPSMPEREI
ncbi:MAG: (2Fe-2S) ferredoxin domain-containing protein [Proteobacteria bacterium]|nr:(2Fe-2S) ferredoxin domain-containing protein [Pseudomonadota bacterium]